jgi:hypothetical protein
MNRISKLRRALAKGMAPGGDVSQEIYEMGDYPLVDVEDCQAVAEAIDQWDRSRASAEPHEIDDLVALLGLLQDVESQEAYDYVREQILPGLVETFQRESTASGNDEDLSEILFLLKILAIYQTEDGIACLIEAVRQGFACDEFLWEVIFQIIADEDHPARVYVCEALAEPLPRGFAAIAYLDLANVLAREEAIQSHPFDTAEGLALLNTWLTDPENFSYAHSAAASLPFLRSPERDALMALAMEHVDPGVQMEAAWASARLGGDGGIKLLARFALEVPHAAAAIEYLRELGREDAVPESSRTADFQAAAEMSQWLAHPNEFGRPPQELAQVDTRELYWPPTNDRRQVWLFRYKYAPDEEGEVHEGLGMVGSVTFSLFGETTADQSPEDAYALHCCWELEVQDDPRTPAERSVAVGLEILRTAETLPTEPQFEDDDEDTQV